MTKKGPLTVDQFTRKGTKSTFFEDLAAETKKKIPIIDEEQLKRDREESEIIDKMVGSES